MIDNDEMKDTFFTQINNGLVKEEVCAACFSSNSTRHLKLRLSRFRLESYSYHLLRLYRIAG